MSQTPPYEFPPYPESVSEESSPSESQLGQTFKSIGWLNDRSEYGGAPLYSPGSKPNQDNKKTATSTEQAKGKELTRDKEASKTKASTKHQEPARDSKPTRNEAARAKHLPLDDESSLMDASSNFASNVNTPQGQPPVPQTIRPTTYSYGGGVAFPSSNSSHHHHQGPRYPNAYQQPPMNRYHGPSSSTHSSALTSISSYQHPGDTRIPGEEESVHMSRVIANRIANCTIWFSRSPGVPGDRIARHTQMMNEISQLTTSIVHGLRAERDDARSRFLEEQKRLRQALTNENTALNRNKSLDADLAKALDREKALKTETEELTNKLKSTKEEFEATGKAAYQFMEHHKELVAKLRKRDDEQYETIKELEATEKRLRSRNAELAKKAGEKPEEGSTSQHDSKSRAQTESRQDFSAPSVPASHQENKSKIASVSENRPSPPARSADQQYLLAMLQTKYGAAKDDAKEAKDAKDIKGVKDVKEEPKTKALTNFNPKAPEWKPTLSERRILNPATIRSGSPAGDGNPNNWLVRQGDRSVAVASSDHRSRAVATSSKQSKQVVSASGQASKNVPDTSIARNKDDWEIPDIYNGIEHLVSLVKGFIVSCHTKGNEAPKVSDDMLARKEPLTWEYLVNLVFNGRDHQQARNHLLFLMSVPIYRPYIIMRVIFDFLCKKVFSPQVFLGIDPDMDKHLAALQDRILAFSSNNSRSNARERQGVVNDHARIIRHALRDPSMTERVAKFREESVDRYSKMMAVLLHPMRATSVSEEEALKGLRILVSVSWEISSKVWISGMTLNYCFPPIASKFSTGTMDAANLHQFNCTQDELQHTQARLCFAITPALSVRDERNEANTQVTGLRKANVLVMK
ncbi:hypothetical protein M426DRAFT_12451 [Hypoxylon sp. CI-4A]|nr:hypothetical protein M426DRAFT_12451 [Hypoxylon sp. CI-4A]